MIRILTYVALFIAIVAGSVLLYRNQPYSIRFEHESAGEVKKDPEKVVATPTPVPTPFGPVPNVVVVTPPPPAIPAPVTTPTPAPTKKAVVRKRKASPATKLKSKWAAPQERPFSLEDLFNVGR